MSDIAIKAENVGKLYRLGQIGTGTISHDLNRWWAKMRGKEDPFAKIGETNDRTTKGDSEYVWSLQDINFEIKKGDAVGIIGRNGAGKSTLLKLLSKVTKPTTGKISVNGRIASLLEVGTGFHPEMTGRENIYLNGAILGMTRKEITRKFDEIVDFSGVERYIDTPVKRYSSGMYVRLAFAVAAHLESEILIVDEVLAVGDAEFQKKCLGKMGDVSKEEGRTVLFVSHNIDAVNKLCNYGMFLENGRLAFEGNIRDVINEYLSKSLASDTYVFNKQINANLFLEKMYAIPLENKYNNSIVTGEKWKIVIDFNVINTIDNYVFAIGINSITNVGITTTWSKEQMLETGKYSIEFISDELFFQKAVLKITLGISEKGKVHFYEEECLIVDIDLISEELDENVLKPDGTTGIFINQLKTKTIKRN